MEIISLHSKTDIVSALTSKPYINKQWSVGNREKSQSPDIKCDLLYRKVSSGVITGKAYQCEY